jgi:hypothetical protein
VRVPRSFIETKTPVLALLILTTLSFTFTQGVNRKLRFPRGATSTVVKGSVVRGDRDRYLVGAKAGQHMAVRISSLENNAVFQIFSPGSKETLQGAGEMDDATTWEGDLPASGDYVIAVGGTRGNASYRLEVSVK